MSEQVITSSPTRTRKRATVIAIAGFTALALAVGVGATALTSGGSGSAVSRSTPATPAAGVTGALCPSDVENLLSAIAAMPPSVSAQVMASLVPTMSQGLGNLVPYVDPSRLPPPPDATTLGQLLARLDPVDRNAVMSGLPADQQTAVAAAEQSAAEATLFGIPPTCPDAWTNAKPPRHTVATFCQPPPARCGSEENDLVMVWANEAARRAIELWTTGTTTLTNPAP